MHILEPIVVEKPWGVTPHLARWVTGIDVSSHSLVGELWIASGLKSLDRMNNQIHNSAVGMTIAKAVGKDPEKYLGTNSRDPKRPSGKTEGWYVRDVKGDVRTITGLRDGIGKKEFLALIKDGFFNEAHSFEELEDDIFTTERFVRGAFYVVLPGTLHTIYAPGKDSHIVIDEIQQGFGDNALPILSKILLVSDSELSVQVHPSDKDVSGETKREILKQYATEPTVRVYDFGRGRKSRPELAAELIRYDRKGFIKTTPVTIDHNETCRRTFLGVTKHFARELIELRRKCCCEGCGIGNRFFILHCVDGDAAFQYGEYEIQLERGMTISVPAWIEDYKMTSQKGCVLYRDYVPDLKLVRETMKNGGATEEEMNGAIIETT